MKLRLGARGSALSLVQARLIAAALTGRAEVEIVEIRTTGDRRSAAGAPIGWKGDFTKELDEQLLAGEIDAAVHSLKDVPAALPEGLVLASVPKREDPRDVLVSHPRRTFSDLPAGSRVGTSSPRRAAQVLAARPELTILPARGNVDTRLRRLREGKWDALVLARAGLARLSRLEEIAEVFSESVMLPAAGQGALGIVARADDAGTRALLAHLDDPASHDEILAERSLLERLEAGCRAPVAARARVADRSLALEAAVLSADGTRVVRDSRSGEAADAVGLGRAAAEELLSRGAAELIRIAEDGR
jgi:hydroxymethylbilane synthase